MQKSKELCIDPAALFEVLFGRRGRSCQRAVRWVRDNLKIVENERKHQNLEDVPCANSAKIGLDSPKLFGNLTIRKKVLIRPDSDDIKILTYDNK